MYQETSTWVHDHQLVSSQAALVNFLTALSGLVAILDSDRRIIWASWDLLRFLKVPVPSVVLGRRLGEVLGCVHAAEASKGCGSTQACYTCGAVDAILESKRRGGRVTRSGQIEIAGTDGPQNLFLEVSAAPWALEDRCFTVVTLR